MDVYVIWKQQQVMRCSKALPRWLTMLYGTQFLFQTKQAFGGHAGRTMHVTVVGVCVYKGGRWYWTRKKSHKLDLETPERYTILVHSTWWCDPAYLVQPIVSSLNDSTFIVIKFYITVLCIQTRESSPLTDGVHHQFWSFISLSAKGVLGDL